MVRLRRDCGTLRRYIGSYATRLKGVHYGPGLVVRGTHRLTLEPDAAAARVWRPLADRIYAAPLIFFSPTCILQYLVNMIGDTRCVSLLEDRWTYLRIIEGADVSKTRPGL